MCEDALADRAFEAMMAAAPQGVAAMEQAAHDVLLGRIPVDESNSPTHCDECGERFMGQARAEVVRKAAEELKDEMVGDHLIIHEACYNPEIHELA